MSRNLGEMGKPKALRDDYFLWFGEVIRVSPTASEVVLVDFMEAADAVDMPAEGDTSPEALKAAFKAMASLKVFIRKMINADDFETYWRLGIENGYSLRDFMESAYDILGVIADRPTPPPSDSSDGRPTIPQRSAAGSSPGGADRSAPDLSARDRRVKERLETEGRPDMALIVLEASERRPARRSRAKAAR